MLLFTQVIKIRNIYYVREAIVPHKLQDKRRQLPACAQKYMYFQSAVHFSNVASNAQIILSVFTG